MGRLALAVAVLFAVRAWGGTALEATRQTATQAHATVESLTREQTDRRAELDALSQTIESLKAERHRTAGADLEADLRRSQALSDRLAELSRALAEATRGARSADGALLSALNAEIEAQERAFTGADKPTRAAIITRLRALRSERDQVRQQLPASALPTVAPTTSDDPTVLLEQADALRDSEDKVRRRLAELDARIAEARSERELDRRMNELSSDDALFDEQDRQLRVTRSADGVVSVQTPPGGVGATYTASGPGGTPTANFPGSGPTTTPTSDPLAQTGATASDHSPQLGQLGGPAMRGDDLGALEQERAKLSALAASLEAQAKAAEQKARAQP